MCVWEQQKERHAALFEQLGKLNYDQGIITAETAAVTKETKHHRAEHLRTTMQIKSLGTVIQQLQLDWPASGKARPRAWVSSRQLLYVLVRPH